MGIEAQIDALVAQTTALLDEAVALKSGVASQIAAAVLVSVSATQIPLVQIATNMVNTQTLYVQYRT